MKKRNINQIVAFTLAEVLITLGIIGVVAAISIPSMINKTQELEYRAAWKKTYSIFSNATNQALNDNGGSIVGIITSADETLRDLYGTYINHSTLCNGINTKGKCWHNDNSWFLLNGITTPDTVSGITGLLYGDPAGGILKDGTIVRYYSIPCTNNSGICGNILVDINGFKKPNTVGKDIYGMWVYGNNLKPFGVAESAEGSSCNPTDNGFACSAGYLTK